MAKAKKTKFPDKITDVLKRPCISPDELHRLKLMPISRGGIYAACATGQIENIRIGKKIVILTAPLRRRLGMEAA